MLRQILLIVVLFISTQVVAQTGIGTITPNPSAKLDVYSDNKGFLPPRVALNSDTDNTTIPNPAEGLLVYNKGSVGLQAGYYYWNGANWATIATATSAGNGVTASDMVKIYDSTANLPTINSTGATFSVTTSGKYSFDFSTSAFCSNCTMTIYFQVRDGSNNNAIIASDKQTSFSNNVHAEYNGKVEANLTKGVLYNVLVYASNGQISNSDWTRVYMKQISGNLPVTGQTVDYVSVCRSGSNQTVSLNDNVIFNNIIAGNIPYNTSTGYFTLSANKTYRLSSSIAISNSESGARDVAFGWKTSTGTVLSNLAYAISPNYNSTTTGSGINEVIFTPAQNVNIALTATYLPTSISLPSTGTVFANIQQIGSSAIINPWTLSGTNSYNTTGNVGIGNNAPTSTLDVTGTFTVSGAANLKGSVNVGTGSGYEGGEIDLANAATGTTLTGGTVAVDIYGDKLRIFENGGNARGVNIDLSKAPNSVGGDLMWKASGIVNAGTFVQLDNLKATVPTSGNRSLSLATVSGSISGYIGGTFQGIAAIGNGASASSISLTTSTSTAIFGWNFPNEGDNAVYVLRDYTNSRVYRINLFIGGSWNNNFISIERLH